MPNEYDILFEHFQAEEADNLGHISDEMGQYILEKVALYQIVEYLGIAWEHTDKGDEEIYYCPFHNDTGSPNLHINMRKEFYHCFACQAQGGKYGFVRQYLSEVKHKPSNRHAVLNLMAKAGGIKGVEAIDIIEANVEAYNRRQERVEEDSIKIMGMKLEQYSLLLSSLIYDYMVSCEWDPQEEAWTLELYKRMDQWMEDEDVENLTRLFENIDEVLYERREKYTNGKIQQT